MKSGAHVQECASALRPHHCFLLAGRRLFFCVGSLNCSKNRNESAATAAHVMTACLLPGRKTQTESHINTLTLEIALLQGVGGGRPLEGFFPDTSRNSVGKSILFFTCATRRDEPLDAETRCGSAPRARQPQRKLHQLPRTPERPGQRVRPRFVCFH